MNVTSWPLVKALAGIRSGQVQSDRAGTDLDRIGSDQTGLEGVSWVGVGVEVGLGRGWVGV